MPGEYQLSPEELAELQTARGRSDEAKRTAGARAEGTRLEFSQTQVAEVHAEMESELRLKNLKETEEQEQAELDRLLPKATEVKWQDIYTISNAVHKPLLPNNRLDFSELDPAIQQQLALARKSIDNADLVDFEKLTPAELSLFTTKMQTLQANSEKMVSIIADHLRLIYSDLTNHPLKTSAQRLLQNREHVSKVTSILMDDMARICLERSLPLIKAPFRRVSTISTEPRIVLLVAHILLEIGGKRMQTEQQMAVQNANDFIAFHRGTFSQLTEEEIVSLDIETVEE